MPVDIEIVIRDDGKWICRYYKGVGKITIVDARTGRESVYVSPLPYASEILKKYLVKRKR